MGLFRCPKCDSICRTEEEVCHICGYRFKPEQPKPEEPKVEEKPQEEKKEESNLNKSFGIGSGFSRKSLFNSVSFDEQEEPKKETVVDDDPFAAFDKKEEEAKEDIFEAYSKQSFSANDLFKETPIEPEVVNVEPEETKPIDVEPTIKSVEEPKVEIPVKEAKPEIKVEKEEKVVVEPKVEEKPKPTTSNPFINNGYKASSTSSAHTGLGAAGAATISMPRTGEPSWVRAYRKNNEKSKKTAITWAIVLFILLILFLILVSNDQKEVVHNAYSSYSNYRGDTYYTKEPKGFWIFMCVVSGVGFLVSLIAAIAMSTGTLYVKQLDGYYVIVDGCSNNYKLVLENRIVDRYYGTRSSYGTNQVIKLSGRLPNKKIVVASVFYKNYDLVIKVELSENSAVNGGKK